MEVIFLIKIVFHRDRYNRLACLLYNSVLTFRVIYGGVFRILAKFQINKHDFVNADISVIRWGFREVPLSRWYIGNAFFLDLGLEWAVSFNGYLGSMYQFLGSLVTPSALSLFFEDKLGASSLLGICGLISGLGAWAFYCRSMAAGGTWWSSWLKTVKEVLTSSG